MSQTNIYFLNSSVCKSVYLCASHYSGINLLNILIILFTSLLYINVYLLLIISSSSSFSSSNLLILSKLFEISFYLIDLFSSTSNKFLVMITTSYVKKKRFNCIINGIFCHINIFRLIHSFTFACTNKMFSIIVEAIITLNKLMVFIINL